jgi:hypothetical protein
MGHPVYGLVVMYGRPALTGTFASSRVLPDCRQTARYRHLDRDKQAKIWGDLSENPLEIHKQGRNANERFCLWGGGRFFVILLC